MHSYEKLVTFTTEELEEYLENIEVVDSQLVNVIFDIGDNLAIRALLSKTDDVAIIKRCVDFDDEPINIALLGRIDVSDEIKDSILEQHSHLIEERWPLPFQDSGSNFHFKRFEWKTAGHTLIVQKELEEDKQFTGFLFDGNDDEITDVFVSAIDIHDCQDKLKLALNDLLEV